MVTVDSLAAITADGKDSAEATITLRINDAVANQVSAILNDFESGSNNAFFLDSIQTSGDGLLSNVTEVEILVNDPTDPSGKTNGHISRIPAMAAMITGVLLGLLALFYLCFLTCDAATKGVQERPHWHAASLCASALGTA